MSKIIFITAYAIVCIFVGFALISLFYTPYPLDEINIGMRLQSLSESYWLGTDQYGRDILSLAMRGLLNSLWVSSSAIIFGASIGVTLGLIASTQISKMSFMINRISDFIFAFPVLIVAIIISLWLGAGYLNSTLAIGIFLATIYIRFVSVSARNIWNEPYIQAAYLCGKKTRHIIWDHIFPIILPLIIIQSMTLFSISIIIEASLSFIGLGFISPQPSLGKMLYDGQTYFFIAPHVIFIPSIILCMFILSIQICGEHLTIYFNKTHTLNFSNT